MKDFQSLRTELNEGIEPLVEQTTMPPNILILRRTTVRQFPNKTVVALYYNDKLNQYFSIPYGEDVHSTVVPVSLKEAEELNEISLKTMRQVHAARTDKGYEELASTRFGDHSSQARFSSRMKAHGHFVKAANTDAHMKKKFSVGVDDLREDDEYLSRPTSRSGKAAQKASWMANFEKHVVKAAPHHSGKISWNDAHYHHSQGHSPEDAAKKYVTSHPIQESHKPGDTIRYRLGAEAHLRVGKVTKIDKDHVVVKRDRFHYKVPHASIVHNDRAATRKELNEISIPLTSWAYHERQSRGLAALKKGDYKTAVPFFKKAIKTIDLRSKKYERERKGEHVRENKETEQIDELSKGTLGSYIRGAAKHKDLLMVKSGNMRMVGNDKEAEKYQVRSFKRTKGIRTAAEKLVNEGHDSVATLRGIRDGHAMEHVKHADGTKTRVDHVTAHALLTVHDALHPDNQKKMSDAMSHSKHKFHKIVDFAWKSVK